MTTNRALPPMHEFQRLEAGRRQGLDVAGGEALGQLSGWDANPFPPWPWLTWENVRNCLLSAEAGLALLGK